MKNQIKRLLSSHPLLFKKFRKFKLDFELFFSSRLRNLYNSHPHYFVFDEFQSIIQAGPFSGMKYIKESYGSDLIPKISGSYEKELFPIIEEILSKNYDAIINIGAAEGYYTVGLAYRLKQSKTRIIAYESNENARSLIKNLATLNHVNHKIKIYGEASFSNLDINKTDSTFILCDIEGQELYLIDPQHCSALYNCDFLIEIHDIMNESTILKSLTNRFKESHYIDVFHFSKRNIEDAKNITWIKNPQLKEELISEHRTKGLKWLLLKRKL
jgi:hypothetical protein